MHGIPREGTKLHFDVHLDEIEFEKLEEFVYVVVRMSCKCEEHMEIEIRLSKAKKCVEAD